MSDHNTIDSVLREDRVFPPPREFAARAHVLRGRIGVDGDGRHDPAGGHAEGSPSRAGSSHDSPPLHSASRTKRLLTVQVRPKVQK